MKGFFEKYPLPIVGLMLGLAAAGNLVQSYGEVYHSLFGLMSALVCVLVLAKMAVYPREIGKSLQNPVVASVFPALSMGIMVLSTYLKPYQPSLAFAMWIIGFLLHVILILWFTRRFVFSFKIKQVFPSWFIVYVGIVVASVTGPAYKLAIVGQGAFWFGLVTYLVLLPIVIYRVVKVQEMAEQTLPTLAIFAAPASLLLAGYMNSFMVKNMALVWFLIVSSMVMYVAVMIMMFKLLRIDFYPSYSGFTFPLLISGIGMKLTNGFLIKSGLAVTAMGYIVKFQELAGAVMTLYVLIRYIGFLWPKNRVENGQLTIENGQ